MIKYVMEESFIQKILIWVLRISVLKILNDSFLRLLFAWDFVQKLIGWCLHIFHKRKFHFIQNIFHWISEFGFEIKN